MGHMLILLDEMGLDETGLDEKLIPAANTKHRTFKYSRNRTFQNCRVFMNKISSYNLFSPNNSLHGPVVMLDK